MIAAVLLAAALAAAKPIEPGTEVIAVVDQIQRNGLEDRMSDGSILTWTVVTMTILRPASNYTRVMAYCGGPPFIGSQPVLVGQHLSFRMPAANRIGSIPLSDLAELKVYVAPSGSIPIEAAKRIFEEVRVASDDDGGKLWGRTLYGPMIVVDPKTRFFVRNDLFIDTLPANVIVANTATNIDGVVTTMIPWTSLQGRTSTQRRRLLIHESWHRIQKDIGFPASNTNNPHLDTVDGRVSLQLELRALAAALRAEGDTRAAAIADAVAFRAARRAQFAEAAETERALENNEGLAEYTGWALRGTTAEESRLTFARHLENIDPATSFVRGFAYETGPAYGLLLDALAPGWTRKYKVTDDLAAFTGLQPGIANPETYGGAELRAAEERRDREQRERVARFRARLVDGPVLELPMTDANYGFDPNGVTALGEAGNAYEHLEVTAAWGKISVDGGARIAGDWTKIIVPAADRAKLELKPGWKIVAGPRDGDLRVVHE